MTAILPELMDAKEAADYLRLSVYTVNEKCRKGHIPAKKFGHRWFIRVQDVAALFDPQSPPADPNHNGSATVATGTSAPPARSVEAGGSGRGGVLQ